jgi:AhpD family alkylhydroperoxidase
MMETTPHMEAKDDAREVAGGIAWRSRHGGHQPLISHRKPGSTRALIRKWRDLKGIWIDERFDPAFREELMLAVAAANSCRQCSYAHREWALAEGLSDSELAALEGLDEESFDPRKWAAIAWASATARSDFQGAPEVIDANFRQHFSPQEQADIDLITHVIYWLNETSNSVDAAWSRFKGEPVTGSTVLSELHAVVLYVPAVPVLLTMLGVMRRRRPMQVASGMGPFFRQFHVKGE